MNASEHTPIVTCKDCGVWSHSVEYPCCWRCKQKRKDSLKKQEAPYKHPTYRS